LFSDKGDRARPVIRVRICSDFLTFFWLTGGGRRAWAAKQRVLTRETGAVIRLSQNDESVRRVKQKNSTGKAREKLQGEFLKRF